MTKWEHLCDKQEWWLMITEKFPLMDYTLKGIQWNMVMHTHGKQILVVKFNPQLRINLYSPPKAILWLRHAPLASYPRKNHRLHQTETSRFLQDVERTLIYIYFLSIKCQAKILNNSDDFFGSTSVANLYTTENLISNTSSRFILSKPESL